MPSSCGRVPASVAGDAHSGEGRWCRVVVRSRSGAIVVVLRWALIRGVRVSRPACRRVGGEIPRPRPVNGRGNPANCRPRELSPRAVWFLESGRRALSGTRRMRCAGASTRFRLDCAHSCGILCAWHPPGAMPLRSESTPRAGERCALGTLEWRHAPLGLRAAHDAWRGAGHSRPVTTPDSTPMGGLGAIPARAPPQVRATDANGCATNWARFLRNAVRSASDRRRSVGRDRLSGALLSKVARRVPRKKSERMAREEKEAAIAA